MSQQHDCDHDDCVPREQYEEVLERLEELEQRVESNEETIEENSEDIDKLDEERDRAARERAELSGRVHEIEQLRDRLDDGDLSQHIEDPEPTGPSVEPQTALEDTISLPESIVDEELSPNAQRARFIARDIREYAKKTPAGWCITAGRVGRVLKAGLEIKPHSETVRRVMEHLDDLGDEATSLRKRRGEKRVFFDDELVERIERISTQAHSAVSRGEA